MKLNKMTVEEADQKLRLFSVEMKTLLEKYNFDVCAAGFAYDIGEKLASNIVISGNGGQLLDLNKHVGKHILEAGLAEMGNDKELAPIAELLKMMGGFSDGR